MKVVLLACAIAVSALLRGADLALCVGIDEYDASYVFEDRWLSGCVADADGFAAFLMSDGGWRQSCVRTLVNAEATGDAVLSALITMAGSAVPGDRVVYYHSGHGYLNDNGEVCLCAYDRDLTGEEVSAALGRFAGGVCPLIVLDVCHSGGFFNDSDDGFSWVASAAAGELTAEADGNGGGVFTRSFVELLRTGVCDLVENGGDGDGVCTAYEAWAAALSRLVWWGMRPRFRFSSSCRHFVMCARPSIAAIPAVPSWPGIQAVQTSVQDWEHSLGSWFKLGDLNGVGWYLERNEDGGGWRGRSVPILDYQRASMEADVLGPGRLSFSWGVSSEAAHDFLTFSVDGAVVTAISGCVDHEAVVFDVTGPGAHRITWTYQKDERNSFDDDVGYVWDISFAPFGAAADEEIRPIVLSGDFTAPKAATLNGVLVKDGEPFGVLQVKIGKASRTGESKVSVTAIGVDGKKYTSKAVKVPTGGTPTQTFEIKRFGTLTLSFGANGFSGSLNGAIATSVEGTAATTDGAATFATGDLSSLAGVLTKYLPTDELVTRTEKKWTVKAKAGKLKYVKPNAKRNIAGGLQATGSNIAGLKLTYAQKTQTFKGSFKVWTFDEAKKKLKSVTAKVTGVVIDGNGYGQAVVKKNVIGELTVK